MHTTDMYPAHKANDDAEKYTFVIVESSPRRGCGISRRFDVGDFGQSRLERARSLFGAEVDTFCANERDVAHTQEAEEAGEIAFLMVGRRTGADALQPDSSRGRRDSQRML